MAFLVGGVNSSDVDIYSLPDSNGQSQISYVGTISKLSSQSSFTDVAVSGSNVSVICANDKCVYVYDVTSSLTTPIKTILHPSPETSDINATYPALGAEYSSATTNIDGVTTTAFPTLETTATNVVDGLKELHSGITSLSGGLCINYDASTGEISIDETDAAANLHVATSGESTTLGGQSASHYRQDVYNIQGNIIN
jgi:hypothetical protein